MTPQMYRDLLKSRLEEELTESPEQAQQLLEASPEQSPNLYAIARSSPPQDWPEQIMICDQMQILLSRINYPKGQNREFLRSELPGLEELIESI
jgi:hypothetical protein